MTLFLHYFIKSALKHWVKQNWSYTSR